MGNSATADDGDDVEFRLRILTGCLPCRWSEQARIFITLDGSLPVPDPSASNITGGDLPVVGDPADRFWCPGGIVGHCRYELDRIGPVRLRAAGYRDGCARPPCLC